MITPAFLTLSLVFSYLLAIVYLVNRHLYSARLFHLKTENFREEINTLTERIRHQKDIHASLKQKVIYYNTLREITKKIQNLSLEEMSQQLLDYAFYLLGRNKGFCLLYLVDSSRQRLKLFLSRKENKNLVVKQKEGDIFDHWVVRHNTSLLVEDAKIDFRFDLDKIAPKLRRPVLSVISAPLRVEQKFLGILRLDSSSPHFYSQDDLRFLNTICSVGALGLENALLFQHTQELAIRDSLTSLFTKKYYLDRLNEQMQRVKGESPKGLTVLMIDIDNFKNYNDRYGHIAGDIVLKRLGHLFLEFFSQISGAFVCRFGGEEFSVFFPDIQKKESKRFCEELRRKVVSRRFILRREKTQVTISIGMAVFSPNINNAHDLIFKADAALYRAKQKGRNQVCVA